MWSTWKFDARLGRTVVRNLWLDEKGKQTYSR